MIAQQEQFEKILKEMPFPGQFGYGYNQVLEAMQKAVNTQWINVKDKLPENGEVVLAFGNGVRASYCKFDNNVFNRCVDNVNGDRLIKIYYDAITHWMPLPAPPQKGTETI